MTPCESRLRVGRVKSAEAFVILNLSECDVFNTCFAGWQRQACPGNLGQCPHEHRSLCHQLLVPFRTSRHPWRKPCQCGLTWVCLVLHFTTWNSFCTVFKIIIKLFLCHGLCAARPVCWAEGSTPGISELGPALPSNRGPSGLERSLSPSLKVASSLTCLSSPWVVPFLFFFFSCKTFTFPYS